MSGIKDAAYAATMILLIILLLMYIDDSKAHASVVCVIETHDIGKITANGKDRYEAMFLATKACLDARLNLHARVKGEEADQDRAELYMEDCVNKNLCKTK